MLRHRVLFADKFVFNTCAVTIVNSKNILPLIDSFKVFKMIG